MAFDVEYARWLEEQSRQINELRSAVNSHASDAELRIIVDNILAHYDDLFRLKGVAAKADVFHLLSGMWKTPAERCFLWLGGFRSSELLKVSSFWCFDGLHGFGVVVEDAVELGKVIKYTITIMSHRKRIGLKIFSFLVH